MQAKLLFSSIVGLLLAVFPLAAQNQALQAANELYRQEAYPAARDAYEALVAEGYQSKALFYNLGNTYYRMEELGRAVLNYERALLLAPKDRQIQENLAFLQEQLAGEIIPLKVFPLISWWRKMRQNASANTWAVLGALCFWIGVAGLIGWLLLPQRQQKVRAFVLGGAGLLLCVIPLLMAAQSKAASTSSRKAVIIQDTAGLYASPSENAELLFPLFAGATVRTRARLDDWYKVNLTNGFEGWVPAGQLEMVQW